MEQLRIGVLGTARIARSALIEPDRQVAEVTIAAVAARSKARAEMFSAQHGIPVAYGGYEELLADPDIDAVYNPLPNSLHAEWTLKAVEAGKHVLCEKPFTGNAGEAERVAAAARDSGLVVMEAMHYRYHPLIRQLSEYAEMIAPVRHIQCWTSFVIPDMADIRYDYRLGGGALMDGGCYAIDCIRLLGDGEPQVTAALADPVTPEGRHGQVDTSMAVRLSFADGATGWLDSSFTVQGEFRADLHVTGAGGTMRLTNFILAHEGELTVTKNGTVVAEETGAGETTHAFQLRAFAGAVLRDEPYPTTAAHAATTMRLIDDAYRAAGLPPR